MAASPHDFESSGTPFKRTLMESGGLAAAEITSMGVSLGVIAVADKVAPSLVHGATKIVAKAIVEPYLESIETFLGTFCRLEECKPDKSVPREKRAEQLARATVLFGAAFVPSLLTKIAVRRWVNKKAGFNEDNNPWWKVWKLNAHDRKVFYWDEGTHIGSMILLNTGTAKHTDELIRGSTSVLQKVFGISERKAHDLSSMAMIWELPNAIGLTFGIGAIAHTHYTK
jgi:hypothetical protein